MKKRMNKYLSGTNVCRQISIIVLLGILTLSVLGCANVRCSNSGESMSVVVAGSYEGVPMSHPWMIGDPGEDLIGKDICKLIEWPSLVVFRASYDLKDADSEVLKQNVYYWLSEARIQTCNSDYDFEPKGWQDYLFMVLTHGKRISGFLEIINKKYGFLTVFADSKMKTFLLISRNDFGRLDERSGWVRTRTEPAPPVSSTPPPPSSSPPSP